MCNRYHPTARHDLNQRQLFRGLPAVDGPEYAPAIGPRQLAPFIKPGGEIIVGIWGLIPWFAKERDMRDRNGRPLMTNNARSETLATKPTFKDAWRADQRCLVPANLFIEPYWGPWDTPLKKTIWWAFARADGEPWMIAGLYNDWTDPTTGEIVPTYTMVTMNADHHPLMRLMHRHDPKLAHDKQDRRSVVPLAREAWDVWLHGTKEAAMASLRLPEVSEYRHGAENPAQAAELIITA